MIKLTNLSHFNWTPDFYSIVIVMLSMLVFFSACALCYILWQFEKERKSASQNISNLKMITESGKKNSLKLTEKLQLAVAMEALYKRRRFKLGLEIFNFNYEIFKLLDKNNLLNK